MTQSDDQGTGQPTGPEQEAIRPDPAASEQVTQGQVTQGQVTQGQATQGQATQGLPPGYGLPQAPQASYDAAPAGMFRDNLSGLLLPEGTELASHGRRIGAFFLAIPLSIVTLGIGYVIWGLIAWSKGTTPALQVLGMRCWRPENREVPGFWWMALREIVGRIADGILSFITGVVSFVLFLSTKERRSLHDMVAGTVVLYDPQKVLPK